MPAYPPHIVRQFKRIGTAVNAFSYLSSTAAGRLALRIFMTPQKKVLSPNQTAFLEGATQSDLILHKHKIRCYAWQPKKAANGKTALFLHGWSSSTARWMRTISDFRKAGYTVEAFDAPGHGASSGNALSVYLYAQVLKAYLEQKQGQDIIVGHSIAAAAAVTALSEFDAVRPAKLALLAGFSSSERVMHDFVQLFGLRPAVERSMDQEIQKRFGQPMAAFRMDTFIKELSDVQGLVIHDKTDDVAPFAEGAALAEEWGGATFVATEAYGHSLYGKVVVDKLLEFADA